MEKIYTLIKQDREFCEYERALVEMSQSKSTLPISVNGLSAGAEDIFLAASIVALRAKRGACPLVLVKNDLERERVASVISSFGIKAAAYKYREPVYYNITASHDVERERLSVLSRVLSNECDCVVATPEAAFELTMPIEVLRSHSLRLSVGDTLSPEELCKKLSAQGFVHSGAVDGKGQFSKRGGIVDFWSEDGIYPVRVEFFGDEIDRMAYFDAVSQRSLEPSSAVSVLPAREVLVDSTARARISGAVRKLLSNKNISEEARAKLSLEVSQLDSNAGVNFADKYIGEIYGERQTLLDYISDSFGSVIFVMGTDACRESLEAAILRIKTQLDGLEEHGLVIRDLARLLPARSEYEKSTGEGAAVHINAFAGGVGNMRLSGLFGFRTRRSIGYGDNSTLLFEDILAYKKNGYKIILASENRQGAISLSETLSEYGIDTVPLYERESIDFSELRAGVAYVIISDAQGFDLVSPKIAFLSMRRDEGRAVMAKRRQNRIRRNLKGTSREIMSHNELTVGDYVVHVNYGIGLFEGIEAVTVDGVTKDYITIRYAGTDKLFVPCERLEVVGKYIGDRESDGSVKLSKMGGAEWHRAKSRAKAAAADIAKELIKIYAERQRTPGFAFPAFSELEDEFDASFGFMETASQLQATEEIRRDMMRPTPMNRLLCGDVGFGKTEVALRAAFKAVLAGKQVAILVPTTLLALQHYQTALSRMRGYAVNVGMLSRLSTSAEKKKIMKSLEKGGIDILIGTHSLLSKELKFRDLGLLVIDEEQRFGVVQKERLREIAKNVDTLMLSATPIPRTLNMAMSGINDISVLDEAPGERRPVQTYVLEHDDGVIYDAISRELARGGQVLYLYNRVEDIDVIAARLSLAFSEARIAFAHGKMEREELEDIWQGLVAGEIDVLVCTTIIETGVDLPSANTLVIENADRFGLSQLHQIRGRVGRSERQAYAYFTYRPGKSLSQTAIRRLEAIKEYAEFGAGFKIALCDLEIRGAGNLLGKEQHGYIESVGYDLYIRLLNEAVLEEKNEKPEERSEAQIVINASANIPESYIPSLSHRMEMYKRISLIDVPQDFDDVYDELSDRFGEVPKSVLRLLNVALSRAVASKAKIKKIEHKGDRLSFISDKPSLDIWSELFAKNSRLSFLGVGSPVIIYRLKPKDDPAEVLGKIMRQYYSVMEEDTEN